MPLADRQVSVEQVALAASQEQRVAKVPREWPMALRVVRQRL